jgi:hypothetical protein
MITGLQLLTALHTALSLLALLAGLAMILGQLRRSPNQGLVTLFLVAAAATSLTGFLFPFHGMTPALGVGIVAMAILAVTYLARRSARHSTIAAAVFAGGLVASEYLLVFVAIAQAFAKIPALHSLAPTQKEWPFAAAQGLAFVIFVVLGKIVVGRSRQSSPGIA